MDAIYSWYRQIFHIKFLNVLQNLDIFFEVLFLDLIER